MERPASGYCLAAARPPPAFAEGQWRFGIRSCRSLSLTTILLSGRNGQVGHELSRALVPLGRLVAPERAQMDLTDAASIRAAIRASAPDWIVNAAAYTAVDRAETEPDTAMRVNAVAPGVMAEEAKRIGALLVHYSTDYVFDGTCAVPYIEDATPNP